MQTSSVQSSSSFKCAFINCVQSNSLPRGCQVPSKFLAQKLSLKPHERPKSSTETRFFLFLLLGLGLVKRRHRGARAFPTCCSYPTR